ncbi:uromodulin-like isoform X2 [Ascaphus truei]|uniref:uromodulin-like isoform X2 n=1 Tax=Ascaphus truei TaxID=8439 RepID=UPI003F5955A7
MRALWITLLLLCCGSASSFHFWWSPENATSLYLANSSMTTSNFPSLTLAVDTTGSMNSNIQLLKAASGFLLNRLSVLPPGDIRQYTLVQFNDPSVGPVYITCSATEFGNYMDNIYTYDGGDCPELAMAGLLLALENSPPSSLIVVTTDASAKDYNDNSTVTRIFSLLDAKQSKVIFLVSDSCHSVNEPQFLIYKDIASHSFGHVFPIIDLAVQSKMVDYLHYMLRTPVNSTTRLFSRDQSSSNSSSNSSIGHSSFSVATNFSALIVTTDGSVNSVRLVGPTGVEGKTRNILSEVWGSILLLENPKMGIWRMYINASGPNSVRIEGFRATNKSSTGNCSKCHINATCEEYLNFYTCTCKDGFIGDGFNCSDYDECSNYLSNSCYYGGCINTYGSYTCACPYGLEMSSDKKCVDINECLRPDLNRCHALAYCINDYGSYACSCPTGYIGNGSSCEFDECTTAVCGFDKDCTKYIGSYSCTDPCFNHTTLNQPWRSMSSSYGYYCDSGTFGWHRFIGSGGIRMPEVCVPTYSCGTTAPMWLSGSHPRPMDGIVNRTACAHWGDYCCLWSTDVQIKACPGGYHIYKFRGAPSCSLGYCTDPATVDDFCACADDEECRRFNGTYGCYCKNTYEISAIETLRPVLTCGTLEIKASFKKCQLQSLNLNTENIHLRDRGCFGFPDYNSTNIISVVSPLKTGKCGNEFVKNETHVIYRNTIYLSLESPLAIGGGLEDYVSIQYSCVYPLDMQISLDTAVMPIASSVNISMEGTGLFVARMALYQDESYFTPYEGSVVLLSAKTTLHIGVTLDGGDTSQFTLLAKNCYATPSSNASDSRKYYIIRDRCPSKQDSSINMAENGVSNRGRFSVQLFEYVKDYNLVYLHCELHVCEIATETCAPSCTGRASRIADTGNRNMAVSVGPIVRQDQITPTVPSSDGTRTSMALLTPTILFLARHLFFIIVN